MLIRTLFVEIHTGGQSANHRAAGMIRICCRRLVNMLRARYLIVLLSTGRHPSGLRRMRIKPIHAQHAVNRRMAGAIAEVNVGHSHRGATPGTGDDQILHGHVPPKAARLVNRRATSGRTTLDRMIVAGVYHINISPNIGGG